MNLIVRKKLHFILFLMITLLGVLSNSLAIDNRPTWILDNDELPKGWKYDFETFSDDRFIMSIVPKEKTVFTIETIDFENSSATLEYIINEYNEWNLINQLEYVYHNDKVDFSIVSFGVVWEVKSPCCYSRGVLYSIDNIYMYIFGSEAATWEEITAIYSVQTIKLLQYLNKEIPLQLIEDAKDNSSKVIPGFEMISLLFILTFNAIKLKKWCESKLKVL